MGYWVETIINCTYLIRFTYAIQPAKLTNHSIYTLLHN